MVKDYKISEPFFEYGPKCYMYGETLLKMAKGLDKLAKKYKAWHNITCQFNLIEKSLQLN